MLASAAVLACALNLLGRTTTLLPIEFVDRPPVGVSANAEAFRVRHRDVIYLITSADAFRTAQRGYHERGHRNACKKLASIIVHEEWHVRNGPDEEGAYLAQLTTLAALGADSAIISGVRRSMRTVTRDQKRRPVAAPALALK